MGGGFSKINPTGRPNSFDVASVRRQIQIRLQDLGFRIMAFQLERANDLAKFSERRPSLEMETEARDLHGDCRSTGPRATAGKSKSRAYQRDRVYARVTREILVFVLECRVDQIRRNFPERRPNPKLLVRC